MTLFLIVAGWYICGFWGMYLFYKVYEDELELDNSYLKSLKKSTKTYRDLLEYIIFLSFGLIVFVIGICHYCEYKINFFRIKNNISNFLNKPTPWGKNR